MFTVFHVLSILGAFCGLLVGAIGGFLRFGWLGLIPGALFGLILGTLCGKLPFWVIEYFLKRRVARLSTEELWTDLRQDDCLLTNFMMLELRKRGEDGNEVLRLNLEMLTADDRERRLKGLAAFWSAFPDFEERISTYNPDAPDEERRESVKALHDDLVAGRLFPAP